MDDGWKNSGGQSLQGVSVGLLCVGVRDGVRVKEGKGVRVRVLVASGGRTVCVTVVWIVTAAPGVPVRTVAGIDRHAAAANRNRHPMHFMDEPVWLKVYRRIAVLPAPERMSNRTGFAVRSPGNSGL